MIREISSFEEYEDFIGELAVHPAYSDPHFTYDKSNLYRSLKNENEFAFAVSENGTTEGLFVWLVLPEERYIEMIIGFTKKEEAFDEMLSFMESRFPGYDMDLVFNPRNTAISCPLKRRGAVFEPEQQKMMTSRPCPNVPTGSIEPLSETWMKQYCGLHNADTYWTAERIIAAPDKFRALLAVNEGRVEGQNSITASYRAKQ